MIQGCAYLILTKNGKYYYYRRYPKQISSLFTIPFFRKSLRTDNLSLAIVRYEALHTANELEWARLAIDGENEQAHKLYELALGRAQSLNLSYLTNVQLLKQDQLAEVMKRVSFLNDENANADDLTTQTIVGANIRPNDTIRDALEIYMLEIAKQEQLGISENQLRVWKNPRKRAVDNFVKLNGNIPMDSIQRHQVIKLRKMWMDRITGIKGVSARPSTAKKDFGYLSILYKEYYQYLGEFDKLNPFDNITFKNMDNDKGVPFPTELIKTMFLADNFKKLNFEARMIFFAFADTGARPSELCGLDADDIVLENPHPHIIIRDKPHRRLKNRSSNRIIPLIGVALEAFKQYPKGFEIYKLNETRLSAVVNKFLRTNEYKPTLKHSFYSLRHSFIDRMEEVGLEEEFRHRMLGHSIKNQEYGKGGSLEFRYDKLKAVEQKYNKDLFRKSGRVFKQKVIQ